MSEDNGERAVTLLEATVAQQKALVRILGAILAVTILATAVGALVAGKTLQRVQHNAASVGDLRRLVAELQVFQDQLCASSEREHAINVRQYKDTLAYLDELKRRQPGELSRGINPFVIGRLPDTEKRARKDTAPPICDTPGLGLPEPDPVLPKRTARDVQRELRSP